ncbi:hypothetical protein [Ralstonia pickettii]|uniref:Uncharacterized protein n=1 Tax=Ralstonia pickettii TaxID=329 RepID=A0AAW4Q7I4_RALPI|nr:hypothetical protein [Ralstonia pickettii]MBA9846753.1 hypothetical protein [Ralstonia pickettii]MBA9852095.1 hypothetical protein [Ralstonia pickettii]MBA9919890.1 hypothetical protein [Ralstonia pickettii]MBA9958992.1 hypothetical protein [Ralstonia pickettii]MBA9964629.1 hypothetical protein [Ralstonia pickettii]
MADQMLNGTLRDHIEMIDEARYLFKKGEPMGLNVAKDFGVAEMRDFLMNLFEQMAHHKLTPEQRELAVQTGLQFSEGESYSLGTLIEAWMTEPKLRDFAAALLNAAMPGAQAGAQSMEGLSIDGSGPRDEIALNGNRHLSDRP